MSQEKIKVDLSEAKAYGSTHIWKVWEFKVSSVKGGVKIKCLGINVDRAGDILHDLGYRQYDNKYYRIVNNVIYNTTWDDWSEEIFQIAKRLKPIQFEYGEDEVVEACGRDAIMNETQRTLKQRLALLKLTPLNIDKVTWLEDDEEHCYIPFINGVLDITKKNNKLIPYDKLHACIWDTQIIQREFKTTSKRSSIYKVLDTAIGKEYRNEYMSAIGYLIHNHIKDSVNPLVICIDKDLSVVNDGGNGKDFVGKIVAQVRRVSFIEGKAMREGNQFLFQQAANDTQIIWITDLHKHYDSENFYNHTDGRGVEINRKYETPFRVKAKIGISLQHSIKMEGRSDKRRQAFLFFHDTIGKLKDGIETLLREGVVFSKGWKGDWAAFYNFIVECCTLYLKKGLIKMDDSPLMQYRTDQLLDEFDFTKLKLHRQYTWYEIQSEVCDSPMFSERDKLRLRSALYRWVKSKGYEVERGGKNGERSISINNLSVHHKSRVKP